MHETCIPEGEYKIKLRTVGGFNQRYTKKYPTFHRGMLWIKDVPGFEYILIHQGNNDEHTSGCLIIGDSQQDLDVNFNGMVGSSANAYQKLYKKVSAAILKGDDVTIEYSKINLEEGGAEEGCPKGDKIDNIDKTLERIETKLKLSKLIK